MEMRVISEPPDRLIHPGMKQSRLSVFSELFIVITLSISLALIFFDPPRWTRAFGEAGLGAFLIWIVIYKQEPSRRLPVFLVFAGVMLILSYVVNVFLSPDPAWEHTNIRKYIYVLIAGLLFAFPIRERYRKLMIILFFVSASIASAEGFMQFCKFGITHRAEGYSGNPIHYAGLLAFVCSTAVIMLFIRNRNIFEFKRGVLFLSIVAISTFIGILFSQARGVWVALIAALAATLLLYDWRKCLIFIFCMTVLLATTFYFSHSLRQRANSITTSLFTEDENGDTGTRIELWKGAILIFKEFPLLGVGTGNFDKYIERLVRDNKLKKPLTMVHAHNIYFQALATRGIEGFIVLAAFFAALIMWGIKEIKTYGGAGGYIIILSTVFTMIGGLTENNIEFTKFLAAYCFTIGLFGPLRESKTERTQPSLPTENLSL